MRVEHEYDRGGALAYLAAYDVHRARLFGRTEPTTGIEPFGRLVEQVMTVEPYASARRVFWVVDNGSSHRGQASIDRLEGAWPNLRLIHLPVHASWLNQIEIVFSIIQRKVVSPQRLHRPRPDRRHASPPSSDRYNATADPFDWTFTRDDLPCSWTASPPTTPSPRPATSGRLTSQENRPATPWGRPDTTRRRSQEPPRDCRPSPRSEGMMAQVGVRGVDQSRRRSSTAWGRSSATVHTWVDWRARDMAT